MGIFQDLVVPYFVGKDARDLERLIDGVYVHGRNYKYAGLPFWNCVGHVEWALFDLLGQIAGLPAFSFFGPQLRTSVPIYASNFARDKTAEETVRQLQPVVERTGATAIKLKVGGRMSNNRDARPGRTEALIPLARRTFGPEMTIYVDSNGSYDPPKAIQIGRMLEAHDVAFFEEPVPWQDFEGTKAVADALDIPIAGGEQNSNPHMFDWMIREGALQIVQPDLMYNGGFIRGLRVARAALRHGLEIIPHSPTSGPGSAMKLHFAAVVPNSGAHQEHRAERNDEPWYEPGFAVVDGEVAIPTGAGLGVVYDPTLWRGAEPL